MATVTRRTIGPADHGKRMSLARFIDSSCEEGWLYELGRGVIDVTEVPGPSHGLIVNRLARLFLGYDEAHPGVITYRAGAGECRLRIPGLKSDRHPDQAVYLDPVPEGPDPWTRWCPHLVVEIVSRGGKRRDYVEKREEYLRMGVREYWVLDPARRSMLVLTRAGDTWEESRPSARTRYRCRTLPGLVVVPDDLFGPQRPARG
jgi:Uma2 family endonuclease